METRLVDVGTRFRKVLATNSTDSATPSKVDTLTEPTGVGIIEVGPGYATAKRIIICPFGTDANNETFDVFVYGWDYITVDEDTDQWHPTLLCQFTATLSNVIPGVAGGTVINTEFFADTLSDPTVGVLGTNCTKISPANDQAGMYAVNIEGFKKLEIVFKLGTGAAANALIRFV